jgi:hypothetical protein
VLDYSRGLFKFDDKLIKCIKVHSVGLLPEEEEEEEDIQTTSIQNFHHSAEGHSVLHYPPGYSSLMEDMDFHLHPTLSVSTMEALGIDEGIIDCVLKVDIKYLGRPRDFLFALRIASYPYFRFAVDQDGTMYMRFQSNTECDCTAMYHFFVGRCLMVKFYKVISVKKRNRHFDVPGETIWWRARTEHTWSAILG